MIPFTLSRLNQTLGGKLLGNDTLINNVSTNSKEILVDCLFVALKGDRFDGHDFAKMAIENGAKALLVNRQLALPIPQIIVPNTQVALGNMAKLVRDQTDPACVAITGSNGKTSVKEMVATILSQHRQTLYTKGNFNNEIGVPLTLLRLESHHEYGVFEVGANHHGEIDYTSSLIRPQVALINNIGAAHLSGFGSKDGVAKAKSEIFNHLCGQEGGQGVGIINDDDEYANTLRANLKGHRCLSFAINNPQADVKASNIESDQAGCYRFTLHYQNQTSAISLPLAGVHQVNNALAAAAICVSLNVSLNEIKTGLAQLAPIAGRMQPHQLGRVLLIDDSYNANPASVEAAIEVLQKKPENRCLVLGDIAELGDNAPLLHQKIGQTAKEQQLDALFCLGTLSVHTSQAFGTQHYSLLDSLIKGVVHYIKSHSGKITILVKGSRSSAMERVVAALKIAYKNEEFV